jgi:hypothetical protein
MSQGIDFGLELEEAFPYRDMTFAERNSFSQLLSKAPENQSGLITIAETNDDPFKSGVMVPDRRAIGKVLEVAGRPLITGVEIRGYVSSAMAYAMGGMEGMGTNTEMSKRAFSMGVLLFAAAYQYLNQSSILPAPNGGVEQTAWDKIILGGSEKVRTDIATFCGILEGVLPVYDIHPNLYQIAFIGAGTLHVAVVGPPAELSDQDTDPELERMFRLASADWDIAELSGDQ